MTKIAFRPYRKGDFNACIDIFDANCPEYLAPSERQDYEKFLEDPPKGYEVCEIDGQVIGVFGLIGDSKIEKRLNWILVDAKTQGMGVGARIMERVIHLGRQSKTKTVGLATSQKVAPFFEKYGATTTSITRDGHGLGIDRVDMVLPL
ncbi:MAG: GNAT family N-acetyltransferase [Woeseiaceae bacterium]|nr:GNAT family N-acetyltransferase [Woeseiaceae bacterium]